MKISAIFVIIVILFNLPDLCAKEKTEIIQQEINRLVRDKKATVGVAFITDNELFTFNDEYRYPLMSVFKFHVAYATLKKMETESTALETELHIYSSQLHKDTYSPLREICPDRDFYLSFGNLLRFCVAESDNNACDMLIDYIGGIDKVDSEIKALGLTNYALTETEASMHAEKTNSYHNWNTPSSMVKLLNKVYHEKLLEEPYDTFLKQVMIETTTGKNKIKAGIPAHVVLGHKTGSSDRLSNHTKIADNDAGVIYLPNGKKCCIAIFIKDSQETDSVNAEIIAGIAKIIYQTLR